MGERRAGVGGGEGLPFSRSPSAKVAEEAQVSQERDTAVQVEGDVPWSRRRALSARVALIPASVSLLTGGRGGVRCRNTAAPRGLPRAVALGLGGLGFRCLVQGDSPAAPHTGRDKEALRG